MREARTGTVWWVSCTLVAALLIGLGATATAGEAKLMWRKTDTSVALMKDGKVVWAHHHDKAVGKPHMKVCLVDGTELTRPWPMPEGYKGYDHTWHKSLWWSWKFINKVNVWEHNQKDTEPVKVEVVTSDDGSARIAMDVAYHLPQAKAVVTEKRVIAVSAPSAEGRYHIDWSATFTGAGKDVVFNKNWYGGMAARMAKRTIKWVFRDSEGREGQRGCARKRSRWIDFSGKLDGGREAGLAIFVHKDNPRQPPPWCVIQGMPYFNPVFTGSEDYTLSAGKTLVLRYRMLVHPGLMTREQVEAEWKVFAEAPAAEK